MISSGDLITFNLVDILQIISSEEKDCILVIENKEIGTYGIYFYKGNPVYIRKVKRNFLLYLDLDFKTVLKRDKVAKEDLFKNLSTYLPLVLELKEGKFSITSGFIKYTEDIPVYIESIKLIIILSRNLTLEEVNRKITDLHLIYEKNPDYEDKLKKLNLNDKEKDILNLINGSNKVSDIIVKLHFERVLESEKLNSITQNKEFVEKLYQETELDVKRTLYGFLAAGLIRKQKPFKKPENILDRILIYLEKKNIKGTLKNI
ncbi:DUF4388 domain-containing protein [Sulfurihydrogenibium subterraneum]|uniref:DUF4388 domain-containing protein n=1 Tax=Sulfurihydrogenibium subterraneum TaxID=171121 RepID=UPI00048D92EB|nr:DUF4388 domain-containing protein [Sulfurihydrogenibium subterraneum]